MSQSLPVARIRLIKVEARGQPMRSFPGNRLPVESPEPTIEPRRDADQQVYVSASPA